MMSYCIRAVSKYELLALHMQKKDGYGKRTNWSHVTIWKGLTEPTATRKRLGSIIFSELPELA